MGWSRSDTIAVIALIASVIAGIASGIAGYYSYSVAKDSRLDAKRQATRADAIALLDAAQRKLEFFNCHFIALGKPIQKEDPQLKNLLSELDTARKNISLIDKWEDHELAGYRESLNETPAAFTSVATELTRKARAALSPEELKKIDQVCKIDD